MQTNLLRRIVLANEILNSLLKEYEQKKLKAEIDADTRKRELYRKIPKLQEIDEKITYLENNYER